MLFNRRKILKVNMVLLHLAVEQAAAEAAQQEVRRQFREQFPLLDVEFGNATMDFPYFESLNITVPGYDVELVQP